MIRIICFNTITKGWWASGWKPISARDDLVYYCAEWNTFGGNEIMYYLEERP